MSDTQREQAPTPETEAAGKKKGGIGKVVAFVVLLVIGGGAGALYFYRDRLLHGLVVHGGRRSFQSAVTLDLLKSKLGTGAVDVDLSDLQVPDRADLATNLFQLERFVLDATPSDLLAGKVHVVEASATGLELFKPRDTPAQPLPGAPAPEPPVADDPAAGLGDPWQALLDALAGEEGATPEQVIERADLATVRYAKGLPTRMQERGARLKARGAEVRGKVGDFAGRAEAAAASAAKLKEEVPARWRAAIAQKRQTFAALEQQLREDPKALGDDPKVEVPKRVQREVADLVRLRDELRQQVATVDGQVGPLRASFDELGPLVEQLQRDVQAGRAEAEQEVAMARAARDEDLERLRELIDPIARNRELIERAIAAALAEDPVVALTEWARKANRLGPDDDGAPEPRFRVDRVSVTGTLHLSQGPVAFGGALANLSDLPRVTGPVTFELSCTPPGSPAVEVAGEIDAPARTVTLRVRWSGLSLAGRALIPGAPEAGDPLPRRFTGGQVDLAATVVSSPGKLSIELDGELRDLAWAEAPAGGPPLVGAVRAAVAGLKSAHLRLTLQTGDGAPSLTVEDLSQPPLGEALLASAGAEATAQAEAAVRPYRQALERRLAELSGEAARARAAAFEPVQAEVQVCVDLRGQAQAHVTAAAPGALTERMEQEQRDLEASATKSLLAAAASSAAGDAVGEGLEDLKGKLPFGGFGD